VYVRLNDFSRQWAAIGREVLEAVERVGESGRYILGERVASFERDLAADWRIGFAVGVASGLDAIEIGLRCLGIGAGDRVLTTPLSAFATTLAILRVGAIPVFVDVDGSGLLDLERCGAALGADRRIRCLLPVHLYGHALDLDELARLGAEREVAILEDCAQSAGATWNGRSTGTAGAAAATSFYPTKNLGALGDGGALLTASAPIAARARVLRHYGQSANYEHDEPGLNSRLDELQAAILGEVLLPRLPAWTRARRHTAARLRREIDNRALEIPAVAAGSDSCCHLFPVLVAAAERAAFIDHLRRREIESAVHYPKLICEQRALREHGAFEVVVELTQARRFAAGEVSLPIHPFLTEEETSRVVAACNEWRGA
jgi:dTDP-4-amino-4,6-dideoxygalactose transaminase